MSKARPYLRDILLESWNAPVELIDLVIEIGFDEPWFGDKNVFDAGGILPCLTKHLRSHVVTVHGLAQRVVVSDNQTMVAALLNDGVLLEQGGPTVPLFKETFYDLYNDDCSRFVVEHGISSIIKVYDGWFSISRKKEMHTNWCITDIYTYTGDITIVQCCWNGGDYKLITTITGKNVETERVGRRYEWEHGYRIV
jgi:hypothetical protein